MQRAVVGAEAAECDRKKLETQTPQHLSPLSPYTVAPRAPAVLSAPPFAAISAARVRASSSRQEFEHEDNPHDDDQVPGNVRRNTFFHGEAVIPETYDKKVGLQQSDVNVSDEVELPSTAPVAKGSFAGQDSEHEECPLDNEQIPGVPLQKGFSRGEADTEHEESDQITSEPFSKAVACGKAELEVAEDISLPSRVPIVECSEASGEGHPGPSTNAVGLEGKRRRSGRACPETFPGIFF